MLSVFFSIGGVVAAVVAIVVVPGNSCPELVSDSAQRVPCDVARQNMGWKYLFFILTAVVGLVALFCPNDLAATVSRQCSCLWLVCSYSPCTSHLDTWSTLDVHRMLSLHCDR